MKYILSIFALAAFAVSGCTFFQDDIYRAQAGYHSSGYGLIEDAIHAEFSDRFGEDRPFRACVEWKYNHWTVISDQRAMGFDKHRVRISAYPQLGADGHYEPVVIARQEIYTGYSHGRGRGGPTAMYAGHWTEAGRAVDLEADIANGIYARLRAGSAGGQ
jgi:hypothetical protein